MSLTEIKNKIKDVPISSIVGQYVALKKHGINYFGLCPFHGDTRPSLTVNDQKGLFKCFPCNVGGDAITFVEKYHSLSFKDAIAEIAERLGIPIDDLNSPQEKDPKLEMGLKLLEAAAKIYQKVAKSQHSQEFQRFLQDRKLEEKTSEIFGLGHSPATNTFTRYLYSFPEGEKKNKAIEVALEIGLIRLSHKENSPLPHYDTFRERIMFPIWDSQARVVGFGSRALQPYQKAKYINSQDSLVFNKRNILYGYHLASKSIRQNNCVLLVEGYMDLIALYQAGITNVVALMGVALTEHHIKTLKTLTSHFILALDSDEAGFDAMKRMNHDLLKHQITPRYLNFSPCKDPDDFILSFGIEPLKKKIEEAPLFLDYYLGQLIPHTISESPDFIDKKIEIMHQIFEELSPLGLHLLVTEKIIAWAQKLGLMSSSEQLIESYQRFLKEKDKNSHLASNPDMIKRFLAPKENNKGNNQEKQEKNEQKALLLKFPARRLEKGKSGGIPENTPSSLREDQLTKVERSLLKEIVLHPDCLDHALFPELIERLESKDLKIFLQWFKNFYFEVDDSEYAQIVLDKINEENFPPYIRESVGAILFSYIPQELDDKIKEKLLADFEKQLRIDKLLNKRNELRQKQRDCSDKDELLLILNELGQIEKDMSRIKFSPQGQ